jgi:hypothetical protein
MIVSYPASIACALSCLVSTGTIFVLASLLDIFVYRLSFDVYRLTFDV